ncbi:hypothetical protein KR018_004204 [Drosophila ironensis]|nr:hypothetical protein KR018_004204 [Drosophila ironensis]
MPSSKAKNLEESNSKPGAGPGSPEDSSAVATKEYPEETGDLVKMITEMGYTDSEAHFALAVSQNNVQRAIHFLVEEKNGEDTTAGSRRRSRRHFRELRACLLENPAVADAVIAGLRVQSLTEMMEGSSVEAMQLLLADDDDEEAGEEQVGLPELSHADEEGSSEDTYDSSCSN